MFTHKSGKRRSRTKVAISLRRDEPIAGKICRIRSVRPFVQTPAFGDCRRFYDVWSRWLISAERDGYFVCKQQEWSLAAIVDARTGLLSMFRGLVLRRCQGSAGEALSGNEHRRQDQRDRNDAGDVEG